jgi:ABC-2 type transport system ATP-binding protein
MLIEVRNLTKHYQVHQKEPGFVGSIKSFINRHYETVKAVEDVSFGIAPGEIVGFLGPNGAGKTTILKVLSGLLYPTSGEVSVMGYIPYQRKKEYLRQFTLVMGQKNQLIWDLPAVESFLVNQAIYQIPEADFRKTMADLADLLELEPLLKKQVRKLSLGERMKCELASALLHRPKILFLDEPTIGLDVTMQMKIRSFIADYNSEYKATVILTSHYMDDVTALCKRVIIINKGHLLYDGDLKSLVERVAPYKLVKVVLTEHLPNGKLQDYGQVEENSGYQAQILVPREETSQMAARLLTELPVADVTIEEPAIEGIISRIFTGDAHVADI